MNKLFCDRCKHEIPKNKEEQFRLTQLWTSKEDEENDHWDLCQYCSKLLLEFIGAKKWLNVLIVKTK